MLGKLIDGQGQYPELTPSNRMSSNGTVHVVFDLTWCPADVTQVSSFELSIKSFTSHGSGRYIDVNTNVNQTLFNAQFPQERERGKKTGLKCLIVHCHTNV